MILERLEIIFIKGGIMMIPLAVCSFLVLLITLERLLILRNGRLISKKYLKNWKQWFQSDMRHTALPNKKKPSILNCMLVPLIHYFPLPQSRLEERLADISRKEKHRLERGLVILDTIAGIAPLFGLLGTALGMVEVFSRLSVAGEAKMSALSSGISQALFTTVAGLCIGIPALIAYNLFSRHVESILLTAEDQLNQLIDEFYHSIIKSGQ